MRAIQVRLQLVRHQSVRIAGHINRRECHTELVHYCGPADVYIHILAGPISQDQRLVRVRFNRDNILQVIGV